MRVKVYLFNKNQENFVLRLNREGVNVLIGMKKIISHWKGIFKQLGI